ncbi:hypothetical protein [Amycolatopsis sp. lyj-346]|uniref:hypothetical protein n=1 Tax=Amycolatopsis sp. lyj-346 TaxID=2789289 RepID=UPI003978C23D
MRHRDGVDDDVEAVTARRELPGVGRQQQLTRAEASAALAADRLTTVVSAPRATAGLTARWPRPPSPTTATRVPGPVPSARSGSQTVMPAHSSGAADAGSSPAGSR